jgi:putrescine transport system permease protein
MSRRATMSDKPKRSWAPYLLSLPTWVVLGGFFLGPLVIMLVISFATRGTYGGLKPIEDLGAYVASGAFLKSYATSLEPLYLQIAWRSLWMAVVTTLLCLLVGYPIAYFVAVLAPARRKNLLLALIVIPFWTSFLIRTYAWMLILRTEGLINTVLLHYGLASQPLELLYNNFAVMIGLVYGELPFMILPLYASLEKLDLSLLEAAADLGCRPVKAFFTITVPLTRSGIVAGCMLVFIPAVGEFVIPALLGGPDALMIGRVLWEEFFNNRDWPVASAVAIAMLFVLVIPIMLYQRSQGQQIGGQR